MRMQAAGSKLQPLRALLSGSPAVQMRAAGSRLQPLEVPLRMFAMRMPGAGLNSHSLSAP